MRYSGRRQGAHRESRTANAPKSKAVDHVTLSDLLLRLAVGNNRKQWAVRGDLIAQAPWPLETQYFLNIQLHVLGLMSISWSCEGRDTIH